MAVRLAVLPVLPIGQRPAAIRTFYQSGKNLRRTILALSAAVCYLLLYLPENLFADNRLLRVLYPHPFTLGLAYNGDRWEHTEKLLPSEQIEEMTFPDENYNYHEMKDYVFIGAYEGANCIGLAILTPVFNPCLFLYDLKVKCKMRGKGIGKQLIKASYQYAIANGYAGLYTVGQDNNLNACLFYLACGFEIGGLDTKIYENTKQSGKFDITFYMH